MNQVDTRDSDSGWIETETAAGVAIVLRLEIATCLVEFRGLFINWERERRYLITIPWYFDADESHETQFHPSLLFFLRRTRFSRPAFITENLCLLDSVCRLLDDNMKSLGISERLTLLLEVFIFTSGSRGFQLICNCQLSLSERQ